MILIATINMKQMQCHIDGTVYMFAIVGASTVVCSLLAFATRVLDTSIRTEINELKQAIEQLNPSYISDTEHTD
jgi:hypothetical protein